MLYKGDELHLKLMNYKTGATIQGLLGAWFFIVSQIALTKNGYCVVEQDEGWFSVMASRLGVAQIAGTAKFNEQMRKKIKSHAYLDSQVYDFPKAFSHKYGFGLPISRIQTRDANVNHIVAFDQIYDDIVDKRPIYFDYAILDVPQSRILDAKRVGVINNEYSYEVDFSYFNVLKSRLLGHLWSRNVIVLGDRPKSLWSYVGLNKLPTVINLGDFKSGEVNPTDFNPIGVLLALRHISIVHGQMKFGGFAGISHMINDHEIADVHQLLDDEGIEPDGKEGLLITLDGGCITYKLLISSEVSIVHEYFVNGYSGLVKYIYDYSMSNNLSYATYINKNYNGMSFPVDAFIFSLDSVSNIRNDPSVIDEVVRHDCLITVSRKKNRSHTVERNGAYVDKTYGVNELSWRIFGIKLSTRDLIYEHYVADLKTMMTLLTYDDCGFQYKSFFSPYMQMTMSNDAYDSVYAITNVRPSVMYVQTAVGASNIYTKMFSSWIRMHYKNTSSMAYWSRNITLKKLGIPMTFNAKFTAANINGITDADYPIEIKWEGITKSFVVKKGTPIMVSGHMINMLLGEGIDIIPLMMTMYHNLDLNANNVELKGRMSIETLDLGQLWHSYLDYKSAVAVYKYLSNRFMDGYNKERVVMVEYYLDFFAVHFPRFVMGHSESIVMTEQDKMVDLLSTVMLYEEGMTLRSTISKFCGDIEWSRKRFKVQRVRYTPREAKLFALAKKNAYSLPVDRALAKFVEITSVYSIPLCGTWYDLGASPGYVTNHLVDAGVNVVPVGLSDIEWKGKVKLQLFNLMVREWDFVRVQANVVYSDIGSDNDGYRFEESIVNMYYNLAENLNLMLVKGGNVIMKYQSSNSDAVKQQIKFFASAFVRFDLIKPRSSRAVNNEFYAVGLNYTGFDIRRPGNDNLIYKGHVDFSDINSFTLRMIANRNKLMASYADSLLANPIS